MLVVAQSTSPVDPFIPNLLQYGVLAMVVVALMFGWLLTKPSVEQERKLSSDAMDRMTQRIEEADARAARAEQQRDQLLEQLMTALPAMRDAAEANKRMMEVVEDAITRFEREQRSARRGPPQSRS